MSEQMKAAIIRALITGLIAAATTALTTWSVTDDTKTIIIAAATAFLGPFITRGLGEGAYDTKRNLEGDVQPSDVGASPVASPVTP
jgi:hypothetical protein